MKGSTKARKFKLTFYGTTKEFPCGKTQDVVLKYIKQAKGGRGGTFDAVLKDGSREAFLDDVFALEGGVIGYEFVPEELPSTQPQGGAKSIAGSKASSTRKRRWGELNEVLSVIVAKSKMVDKSSTPYSSVEWQNIENCLTVVPWDLTTLPIEDNVVEKLHTQLVEYNTSFGSVESGKEAKRLYFIAPILSAVAYMFKDQGAEKVTILVEEDVDGVNIHANAHFEFILKKGNRKVCIVEAKKELMEKGMAQSILGCEAISDVENVSVVYAVVTNFLEWIFIKDTDDFIYKNSKTLDAYNGVPRASSLAEIAGMLYKLLTDA